MREISAVASMAATATGTANATPARPQRRSASQAKPSTAALAPNTVNSSALLIDLLPTSIRVPRQASWTGKPTV